MVSTFTLIVLNTIDGLVLVTALTTLWFNAVNILAVPHQGIRNADQRSEEDIEELHTFSACLRNSLISAL
jgi:hypothetical protein